MFGDGILKRTPFTMLDKWLLSLSHKIDHPGPDDSIPNLKARREQVRRLQRVLQSLRLRSADHTEPSGDEDEESSATIASIGIEVIGAQLHDRVLDYATKARQREALVDDFSLRLAGLAQNVFDFRRQDVEEVNNSLSSAARIGTDITFAQQGVSIRFMETSRAYREMRTILGGSPYWLLVQLIIGHNEYLLSELNSDLEAYRRSNGLVGMVRELFVPSNVEGISLTMPWSASSVNSPEGFDSCTTSRTFFVTQQNSCTTNCLRGHAGWRRSATIWPSSTQRLNRHWRARSAKPPR